MEFIASYPVTEDILRPHIGKTVLGVTRFGDEFCGVLHACKDGHIHLRPIGAVVNSKAAIRDLKKKIARHPKAKKHLAKIKSARRAAKDPEKANISQLGYGYPGFGYPGYSPFGSGFGFGLGAGIGFALPLFLIGALFLI